MQCLQSLGVHISYWHSFVCWKENIIAKRFTDTDKWKKPWFRKLPVHYKSLWCYILDTCDMSGVWDVDIEAAGFHVGYDFDEAEVKAIFDKQIHVFKPHKWWVVDFIPFQYGTLSETCKPHTAVVSLLKKHTLWIDYTKGMHTLMDKDKDKDKDNNKERIVKENQNGFVSFFEKYPKKVAKPKALQSWLKISPSAETVDAIMVGLAKWKVSPDWLKDNGQFIPHPATWLNQRRWEDEIRETTQGGALADKYKPL